MISLWKEVEYLSTAGLGASPICRSGGRSPVDLLRTRMADFSSFSSLFLPLMIFSFSFQWNLSFFLFFFLFFFFFFANLSCRPMEEGNEMLNCLDGVRAEVGFSECFVWII